MPNANRASTKAHSQAPGPAAAVAPSQSPAVPAWHAAPATQLPAAAHSASTLRRQVAQQQWRLERLRQELRLPHRVPNVRKLIKATEERIAQLQALIQTVES